MSSFTMDENGNIVKEPATVQDFCNWANAYQPKYFTGQMPAIQIAIIDDSGGVACFAPDNKTAYIEKAITRSHKFSKIALLHEMVHINLWQENGDADQNHGERFMAQIKRLIDAGAYDKLL